MPDLLRDVILEMILMLLKQGVLKEYLTKLFLTCVWFSNISAKSYRHSSIYGVKEALRQRPLVVE
jgi:hypothetical protein